MSTVVTETVEHWINGETVSGASERSGPVFDPALGEVAREVRLGGTADVAAAVAVAKAAFPAWSGASWAKRQQVLFAFREILNAARGSWRPS